MSGAHLEISRRDFSDAGRSRQPRKTAGHVSGRQFAHIGAVSFAVTRSPEGVGRDLNIALPKISATPRLNGTTPAIAINKDKAGAGARVAIPMEIIRKPMPRETFLIAFSSFC